MRKLREGQGGPSSSDKDTLLRLVYEGLVVKNEGKGRDGLVTTAIEMRGQQGQRTRWKTAEYFRK